MSAKHTPGPWYAVSNGHYIDITTEDRPYSPSVASVCESKHNWGEETAEANARLIAAAPQILDALTEILDAASSGEMDDFIMPKAIRAARAAIAKATGEEPS